MIYEGSNSRTDHRVRKAGRVFWGKAAAEGSLRERFSGFFRIKSFL